MKNNCSENCVLIEKLKKENYHLIFDSNCLVNANGILQQALNEIREYIKDDNYKDENVWVGDLMPILQIIDKVLGDDENE